MGSYVMDFRDEVRRGYLSQVYFLAYPEPISVDKILKRFYPFDKKYKHRKVGEMELQTPYPMRKGSPAEESAVSRARKRLLKATYIRDCGGNSFLSLPKPLVDGTERSLKENKINLTDCEKRILYFVFDSNEFRGLWHIKSISRNLLHSRHFDGIGSIIIALGCISTTLFSIKNNAKIPSPTTFDEFKAEWKECKERMPKDNQLTKWFRRVYEKYMSSISGDPWKVDDFTSMGVTLGIRPGTIDHAAILFAIPVDLLKKLRLLVPQIFLMSMSGSMKKLIDIATVEFKSVMESKEKQKD